MAIAYVGKTRQTGSSVSSFTMTADVGSGTNRLLVVVLLQRSTTLRAMSAITYNGVALSQAGSDSDNTVPTTKLRASVYYLANPTAGSNTLSVSWSGGTVGQYECQASWYNGADIASPYVGANGATGQSNAPAVSLDPGSVNGCLLVAGVIHEYQNALSTDAGETAIYNNDNGAWVCSSSLAIQTTAASQSMNWSAGGSDYWAAAGGIFRADVNDAPTVALNTADESSLDETPTLEFTGTDADGDDVRYQIQIADNPDFPTAGSNTFENAPSGSGGFHENGMASLTWEGHYHVDDRFGISFMGHGGILDKISIELMTDTTETDGYALVRVYAHEGVYGTSSAPLNPADPADTPTPGWLAQSELYYFDDTTINPKSWKDFAFTGANRIRLEDGVPYVLIVDWRPSSGTYNNLIELSTKDPSSHAGNVWIDSNSPNYGVYSAADLAFQVYETSILLDKVSGTDAGFANTVNGGDTDPFNSGEKVSFTVQAGDALTPWATYWWKVRAIDPAGSNQWGEWSETRSFTVTSSGTTKSVSDTGAGADAIGGVAVSLALADTGSGAESFGAAASLGLADTGTGNDALAAILASLSMSDTGAGVDVPGILAALGLADAGSGADILGISVSLSVAEIGAGTDLVDVLTAMLKQVTDSGAGADGLAVNVALAVSDIGSGQDAASQVTVTLTVTDAGAGADLVSVLGGGLISILESGAGVDGFSIAVAPLSIADNGAGADSLVIRATVGLADSASGADAVSVLQTAYKLVSELATGTDALGSISVSLAIPESGSGSDLIGQILAWVVLAESGTGVDLAVAFDSAVRIATITFSIARRTMAFSFARRSIDFSLASREIEFELN